MKPLLPLALSAFLLLNLSCHKLTEDRVEGRWRLEKSYYQGVFDRDYFDTGYEDGTFVLDENGQAFYAAGPDTLFGYWEADFYTIGNGDDRDTYKYLHIQMADFSGNRFLVLDFDDYHFQRNWKCLRAVQFRGGRDKCYEFVRP